MAEMDDTIVERVATAIWPWSRTYMAGVEQLTWAEVNRKSLAHEIATDCARAAILSLRSPSVEMIHACLCEPTAHAIKYWNAMIDTALTEGEAEKGESNG